MKKFNIEMSEAKKIVDYISIEVYENENIKSKESVNIKLPTNEYRNSIYGSHIYKFSLWQYFIHNFIYKLIFVTFMVLIFMWFEENSSKFEHAEIFKFLVVYSIIMLGLIIWLYYKIITSSTSIFSADYGIIYYQYNTPDLSASSIPPERWNDARKRRYIKDFYRKINYEIVSINKVKETSNNIIIYGNVYKSVNHFNFGNIKYGQKKKLEIIKVPKCFKNNGNLIKSLQMLQKQENK